MTDLKAAAVEYLALRRSLGYKLTHQGRLLEQFVEHLDAIGADITVAHALAWATEPTNADPVWWNTRLSVVRGFAKYLHAFDSTVEVPPAGVLPSRSHRATPYLYTDTDIARLAAAAGTLRPPLRAATYQTLIGLLLVTGIRLGEAVGLDNDDVDFDQGLLTIRQGKYGKARQLPLHVSTLAALRDYAQLRQRLCPRPKAATFLVSSTGTRVLRDNVCTVFALLVRAADLHQHGRARQPRPHDLRHSFAVRTLLGWYRDGGDVQARLPLLSTYMGHIGPESTYWYLTAAPELLALAAERLERTSGTRS